jgi:hypothetical protein
MAFRSTLRATCDRCALVTVDIQPTGNGIPYNWAELSIYYGDSASAKSFVLGQREIALCKECRNDFVDFMYAPRRDKVVR